MIRMNRVSLVVALSSVALANFAKFVVADETTKPAKPNFLFIYTDDQRWDTLGVVQREQGEAGRFPFFRSPHLDRLAADGFRFRNAFVVSSLCAPSRAAFLTGRYNHLNGIANNHTPFPAANVTLATLLGKAGYETGYIGKWHMGQQKGKRPGFGYSASFIGQGKYFDCPFEIDGTTTPTEGWVDDRSTDFAVGFLKKNKEKPFALIVGFKSTHGPFDPPDRAKDRYVGETARRAPNMDSPAPYRAGQPAPAKAQAGKKANPKANAGLRNPPPAGEPLRAGVSLNYMRCLSAMDDNMGRLLDAVDELKLTENTVVVFASDNGFYLGEHRLGDKRSAYDESLRIPLLVRYPRLASKGKVLDQMVLNIDLAPTLLDFAGVPIPAEMQGKSWRPLLEGQEVAWRSAWLYEYFEERGFAIPTIFAVRTDTAKLIKYPGHDEWTEVFDLKADPFETKNLANEPGSKELRERLEHEFDVQAKAVDFKVPDYADEKSGALGNR